MTAGRKLKKWWKSFPASHRGSLRAFARKLAGGYDDEALRVAQEWLVAKDIAWSDDE